MLRKQLYFQASSKVSSSRLFDKNEANAISKAYIVYHLFQTGNHVCVEDIDIELGEVCTAITKYAMSNKNCEIEVEKHELTSMTSGAGPPLGIENSNANKSTKPEEDADVGFITQIDKDGNIQQVPIKFEGDQEEEANPLAMAGMCVTKKLFLYKLYYYTLAWPTMYLNK